MKCLSLRKNSIGMYGSWKKRWGRLMRTLTQDSKDTMIMKMWGKEAGYILSLSSELYCEPCSAKHPLRDDNEVLLILLCVCNYFQKSIQLIQSICLFSVFAYGATGAGKTHTMLGNDKEPGVIYYTMIDLYRRINDQKDEKMFDVAVSYSEVSFKSMFM